MKAEHTNGGFGLAGLVFLLFLGLKLTGYIAWSWWWVTAPLWLPFVIVGAIFIVSVAVILIFKR